MGWHTPELTTVQVRLQGQAMWQLLFFVLNALLFALVGIQLPAIIDALSGISTLTLIRDAAIVSGAVIGARFLWIFASGLAQHRLRIRDLAPHWGSKTVLAWSGMRGAVSLAAALALPLTTDAGAPFPDRELVIFLTFGVILATLVLQGLTLPAVIRLAGFEDDGVAEKHEAKARIRAAEAALQRLEELLGEDWVRDDTAERMRGLYNFRVDRFRSRVDPEADGEAELRSVDYQRLRRELLEAERQAVFELRRTSGIDDETLLRVLYDLDLEEARLDA
jgi:CPA1 family monovalent cation:H+ antiporter